MSRKTAGCVLGVCLVLGLFTGVAHALDVPFGYSVETEQREVSTGEHKRIHIFNTDKKKVSILIDYRDGRREVQTLRPEDGSLKSKSVSHPGGGREQFDYYQDGKLMRETKNGVVLFERRKLADGTVEAIRFKPDGKSPQMLRRVGPKGEFELVHYRTGKNEVWFRFTMAGASGSPEWQYFAKDGSRLRRVVGEKEMVVTGFDPAGNYLFEQVWKADDKGNFKLHSVSERRGTIMRRYVLTDNGGLDRVEDIGLDGSIEQTLKPGDVEKPAQRLLGEYFESDDPTVPEPKE